MATQAQAKQQTKTTPTRELLPSQLRESESLNQAIDCVRDSIRNNPEAAALWCLGIGFVLGWKLKPW